MITRAEPHSDLTRFESVICVPARDEAKHLPDLMAAVAEQNMPGRLRVVVALNNITDESAVVLRQAQARFAGRLAIHIDQTSFPEGAAHAGSARRRVMDLGLKSLSSVENAVLLSTDADARPDPSWLSANLASIAAGVDLVGGRIDLDDGEPLSAEMRTLLDLLDKYWVEVRAIEDRIDPVPWDLPPRHGDHTGASLAITARAYLAAGGVPPIPSGEDRALVAAARAAGARLRHAPDVRVRVSARAAGRAAGGMADYLRGLEVASRTGHGPFVPSFEAWQGRARWRRALRQQPDGDRRIAVEEPNLPPMIEDFCVRRPGAGR